MIPDVHIVTFLGSILEVVYALGEWSGRGGGYKWEGERTSGLLCMELIELSLSGMDGLVH